MVAYDAGAEVANDLLLFVSEGKMEPFRLETCGSRAEFTCLRRLLDWDDKLDEISDMMDEEVEASSEERVA